MTKKTYTIPIIRTIESQIAIEAGTYKEARETLTAGFVDGTIEVPDENQFWNDWQIDEDAEKERIKNLRQLQECEPGDLLEYEKDIIDYFNKEKK